MPNALILSSCFDGHRQIHVFVYVHILKKLGFDVFIIGDFQEELINSFYIDKLKSEKDLTLIEINNLKKHAEEFSLNELLEAQDKYKIDLTIFTEADIHIELLTSQISSKKRLRGANIGLFFRPLYFYKRSSIIQKAIYIKRLLSKWKSDEALFHEHLLKRYRLLDTAFYLDEKFVSCHKYTRLLPDVFQSYTNRLLKDEFSEQRVWIDRLNSFKERNKGKFVFLYFGTVQKRRGYDILLRMAIENNACFIHCGLFYTEEEKDPNTIRLREILKERGCLFETNEYISNPTTIECFFRSTDHLILPYEMSLGSSGVMLQALEYGIPCLMPDTGVPGYLIRKYNLGLTYNYSTELLENQLKKFIKTPTAVYKGSIEEYIKSQSPEQLENILTDVFTQVIRSQKKKQ